MRRVVLAAAVLAASVSGAVGQDGPGWREEVDRFKLWTGCQRMNLVVSARSMGTDGLTPESMRNLVETRLQAARLYDAAAAAAATLHLRVEKVFGAGFLIVEMEFWKWLYDPASDHQYLTTTWARPGYWPETSDANTVRNAVSRSLDEFLVEYLRVNKDAC